MNINNNINNNINYINQNNYANLISPFKNEVDTYHESAILESTINRLYNSILEIRLFNGKATGFFMKFILN